MVRLYQLGANGFKAQLASAETVDALLSAYRCLKVRPTKCWIGNDAISGWVLNVKEIYTNPLPIPPAPVVDRPLSSSPVTVCTCTDRRVNRHSAQYHRCPCLRKHNPTITTSDDVVQFWPFEGFVASRSCSCMGTGIARV